MKYKNQRFNNFIQHFGKFIFKRKNGYGSFSVEHFVSFHISQNKLMQSSMERATSQKNEETSNIIKSSHPVNQAMYSEKFRDNIVFEKQGQYNMQNNVNGNLNMSLGKKIKNIDINDILNDFDQRNNRLMAFQKQHGVFSPNINGGFVQSNAATLHNLNNLRGKREHLQMQNIINNGSSSQHNVSNLNGLGPGNFNIYTRPNNVYNQMNAQHLHELKSQKIQNKTKGKQRNKNSAEKTLISAKTNESGGRSNFIDDFVVDSVTLNKSDVPKIPVVPVIPKSYSNKLIGAKCNFSINFEIDPYEEKRTKIENLIDLKLFNGENEFLTPTEQVALDLDMFLHTLIDNACAISNTRKNKKILLKDVEFAYDILKYRKKTFNSEDRSKKP